MSKRLVHFRADPAKVRISVRRVKQGWRARLENPAEMRFPIMAIRADIERAINEVLGRAAIAQIDGIDLELERLYRHPWPEKGAS